MVRPYLPLKALRAFEASARHLSFTRAAEELCVTQAAVSHQVKLLESSFDQMAHTLGRLGESRYREVLNIGVVGIFAIDCSGIADA